MHEFVEGNYVLQIRTIFITILEWINYITLRLQR